MSAIENLFGSSAVEYTESGGYDQKAALLECISSGDAERIEGVVKRYIEHLRDFVQDDMGCARDAMYFVWAQFNLAATRAGLSEYVASDIHKGYYRRLESAENTEEILAMCRQHAVDLCKAVSNVRRELGYSEPVAACCAYIREHIYEKLTVDGLSEALHIVSEKKQVLPSWSLYIGKRLRRQSCFSVRIYQYQILLRNLDTRHKATLRPCSRSLPA